MRPLEEIDNDVYQAAVINDIDTLARCAAELEDHTTPEAEALRLRARGRVYLLRGDRETALDHFQRALDFYVSVHDANRAGIVSTNIGILHASIGNFPVALEYCHQAVGHYEVVDNQEGIASVTMNVGAILANTSDYPGALEHFHRALAHHQATGSKISMANALGNIGAVNVNIGSYEEALKFFHQAMSMQEQIGDHPGLINVFVNIGSVHFNLGEIPEALASYRRARALNEEHDLSVNKGLIISHIGRTYLVLGSVDDAQIQLETLDSMTLPDPAERVEREHLRAKIHEANGHLDDAVATLKNAIVIATEHNLRSQVAELHESLRDLALKRNDLAAYVEHNTAFTRITEEVNGKETAAKMAMQAKQREIDAREREHEKQLAVLHSTLPKHIADRVARGEQVNDHYDNAVVIFLDIVGFTSLSDQLSSAEVIQLLDTLFTSLDAICKKHDVVKIKTIGDSYMAVSFPSSSASPRNDSHIFSAANAALEMLHEISHIVSPASSPEGSPVQVRIGMHSGPVTAGVLGKERLQYDVWGDTVNVASRMESSGEPGKIHVSEAFAQLLSPHSQFPIPYSLRERGEIEIKGKGLMTTYWLTDLSDGDI